MSIKIEGPGGRIQSGAVRRSGRTEGGGGAFSKQVTADNTVSNTGSINAAAAISGVDSLLALQEVDDATARASRGKKRAEELLDRMDDLRHALLAGVLPQEKLVELSRQTQSRRVQVDDPKLAAILDEIDLRAQVELAKLQR
ncbi:Flagellar assembly protein FliX [Azospirillaceae bacterium]